MRILRVLRIASASPALLLLASCNGSDSGSGAPGIYFGASSALTGTYTGAQSVGGLPSDVPDGFVGAVAPNGTGYFGSPSSVLILPGLLTSTSTATSATYLQSDPVLPFGSGSTVLNVFARGGTAPVTVPASISLTGTNTLSGTIENPGINLLLNNRFAADVVPALPASTTNYHGFYMGGATSVVLALDSSRALSGVDENGCKVVGVLVPVAGTDEYQVSANIEGGSLCAGGVYGVALAMNNIDYTGVFSNASGTYLYIVTATPDFTKAFAVEAVLQ